MYKAHVSANFTAGHAGQGDLGLAYLLPPGCRSSSLLRLRARRAAAVYKHALAFLTCIVTACLGLGSHALVKFSYISDQFHKQASHSGESSQSEQAASLHQESLCKDCCRPPDDLLLMLEPGWLDHRGGSIAAGRASGADVGRWTGCC